MKFAICNETYQDWAFEKVCDHVAGCGYQGIEIAPFTLNPDPRQITEAQAEQVGQTARAAGLEVIGLHWLLVKPEGLHITTPDDGVRKQTVDFLKHLAALCGAMDGKVLVFGSPKQRDLPEGVDYEDGFARAVDVFSEVSEAAAQAGVVLALEPLGPVETNFMVTAEETIQLIDAVAHRACRLHLDVKAMSSETDPIERIIKQSKDHLEHFHANDANRRGPGFGDVDFVPIAKTLKEIGYDRWVSVEVFDYSPSPEVIAEKSLEYLKRTFAEAGAV